jgi:hypothetical protein
MLISLYSYFRICSKFCQSLHPFLKNFFDSVSLLDKGDLPHSIFWMLGLPFTLNWIILQLCLVFAKYFYSSLPKEFEI